jgi:DNA-binding IclR family transcriptional regulator
VKHLSSIPNSRLKSGLQPLTSLSKSLRLLLTLRDAAGPMNLTEISHALGLNKVTALRILVTMEQYRFVEKDLPEKRYKIGCNAFYVGSGFIAGGQHDKVLETMKDVVQELKHTITLGVLDGASVLFVERVDGTERVKVTVDIGSRVPAYSSAAGKALLAGLSDREIVKRLKPVPFERFTDTTLRSLESLAADIAKVRARGFAVNNEESTKGLVAVAVPVKNQLGQHVAALGAAFPAGMLKSKEDQKKVAKRLAAAADEISRLGIRNSKEISTLAS